MLLDDEFKFEFGNSCLFAMIPSFQINTYLPVLIGYIFNIWFFQYIFKIHQFIDWDKTLRRKLFIELVRKLEECDIKAGWMQII